MIRIGQTYELVVVRAADSGFYLDGENLGEVLLPHKYAPTDISVGDDLEVFLYFDSAGHPVATTQNPRASVGEFAYLKVVGLTPDGAFLDWGLDRDLHVPLDEQDETMEVDMSYLVYVHVSETDGRIIASSKIEKFLDDRRSHSFKPWQRVKLIIGKSCGLDYRAIINDSHWGILYKNEISQRLHFGQTVQGIIKRVRDDGRIDVGLHYGHVARELYAQVILNYLKKQNGFAPVHDGSDPAMISRLFGMSKSAFKKAIGGLCRKRLIHIEKGGIRLAKTVVRPQ